MIKTNLLALLPPLFIVACDGNRLDFRHGWMLYFPIVKYTLDNGIVSLEPNAGRWGTGVDGTMLVAVGKLG